MLAIPVWLPSGWHGSLHGEPYGGMHRGPHGELHGGPVTLTVAGDGAGGVTVRAVYKNDGHAAEALRLVLNAEGDTGRRAGPVQLNGSAEGRGFYSSGRLLTPGRWEVTVTSPEPNPGTATVTVNAVAPQSQPAVTRGPAGPAPDGAELRWWPAAAAALGVVVVAFAAGLWWWRRKST